MDVLSPAVIPAAPVVPLAEQAFHDGEEVGSAIRRICVEHLDLAIAGLSDTGSPDEGVHAARKALKRVRAMIRLVRDPLGRWTYRQENVVLRDAGRTVSPVRDGAVLVHTLDGIVDRHGRALAPGLWDDLRGALVDRHRLAAGSVLGDPAVILTLLTTLRTARRRFAAWPAEAASGDPRAIADRFDSIAPGIQRVYARGRRAMGAAAETGSEEDWHGWRKRVKYLRHQLEALDPVWPELLRATATELDRLGEVLGAEHDLAVLDDAVRTDRSLCPDPAARRVLHALIAYDRSLLQHAALALGGRLYAETPGVFTSRLGAYWAAWRPVQSA